MSARSRLLLYGSTTVAALAAGGYLAASGMADGTTPPPVTVTTTTPSVSVPNPLPAPQPSPTPASKPVSKPRTPAPAPAPSRTPTPVRSHPAAPTPAPTPVYSSPSATTHPVVATPRVTRARPARPAARRTHAHVHRRVAHKHPAATRVDSTTKPTAPRHETAPNTEHLTTGHSRLLFYLFAGLLLAVGAATVLWSPRLRRTGTASQRSAGRTTRPREVVAELVHVPSVAPATPALIPPTNGSSTVVLPEPEFDSAVLFPTYEEDSAETAVTEPAAPSEEFCEIAIWRGYAKSRFYARLDLAESDDIAVGESKIFGLRGKGEPARTRAAGEAHHGLVAALLEEGWEAEPPSETGPWYATRFRRLVAVDEHAAEAEYALET